MVALSIWTAVLLLLACSSLALSSLLLWQEIGEINRRLPDAERISYWGIHPTKMAKIQAVYRRLYPSGKLDIARQVSQYVGFALLLLLLIPLGFFR